MAELINESEYGPFSSNLNYIPPNNFGTLLADFYALTAVKNQFRNYNQPDSWLSLHRGIELINNIINAQTKATLAVKDYFIQTIPYLVAVEMRHIHMQGEGFLGRYPNSNNPNIGYLRNSFDRMDRVGYLRKFTGRPGEREKPEVVEDDRVIDSKNYHRYRLRDSDPSNSHPELAKRSDFIEKEIDNHGRGDRDTINQTAYFKLFVKQFNDIEKFMDFAIWAFNQIGLWEEQYGGPPWAQIATYWKKLNSTNDNDIEALVKVIDDIVDLQHNTGSAFNKIASLYKTPSREGFNWFDRFLDEKAQYPIPYGYLDKLSSKVKNLITAFYKASLDLSYEDYKKLVKFHNDHGYGQGYTMLSCQVGDRCLYNYNPEDHEKYEKYKHLIKTYYEIQRKR